METLVYLHLSTADGEPANVSLGADDLKLFEGLNWKLPSSAWIRFLSVVLALSIVSATTNALAVGGFLHRGSRGTQVVALQNNLKTAGYFPSTVRSTGFYGSVTVNAVRRFQQARGLQVDGVAGPRTLSALGVGSSPGSLPTSSLLRRGSRGSTVTQLQNRLRALGFFNGPITGYYGQLTQDAVSRFQQARGLRVDGVAGPRTLSTLQSSTVATNPPFAGEPAVASTLPITQLQRGSRGSAVTQLQNQLKASGFFNGPVSGYYGELTEASVRNFQRSNGLFVNGIADASTLTALQSDSWSNNNQPTVAQVRPVEPGSTGPAVSRLQTRLRDLGFYKGAINGAYGPLTETAVRDFQRSRQLAVNGIAGNTTVAALN